MQNITKIIEDWHKDNKERFSIPIDDMLALSPYLEPLGNYSNDEVMIIRNLITQIAMYKMLKPHGNINGRPDKKIQSVIKDINSLKSFINEELLFLDDEETLNTLHENLSWLSEKVQDKKWLKLHSSNAMYGSPFSATKSQIEVFLESTLTMLNRTMKVQDKRDLITSI